MVDLRKALAISAAIYAIVFWAATVAMPFGQIATSITAIIATAVLVYCGSKNWYFNEHKPKSLMDGVVLGVIFLAIAMVMEILAMVYGLKMGWTTYLGMVKTPFYWIGTAMYIIVPTLVAYMHLKK